MRIALVQLDANDHLWSIEGLRRILNVHIEADLIVLPECMPFDSKCEVEIEEAHECLAKLSKGTNGAAILAGGYVRNRRKKQIAAFLSYKGETLGSYFKRRLWGEEEGTIDPGKKGVCFSWERGKCIPLICADAADSPSPTGTQLMYEAIRLGACESVPIVVSTYGALTTRDYWPTALQTWARGCGCPVVVCAVSGKGEKFDVDGDAGYYGGGGSGVFWYDDRKPMQYKRRGILLVDTDAGTLSRGPLLPSR